MKTIFFGGNILTMEDNMYAEAVLTENGKILAVGQLDALKAQAGDYSLHNLQGKTMLPSFIDPHSHFFQVACSMLQASLDGCSSAKEIKVRIQNFIEKNQIPAGQWVVARDYDNNLMPGVRNPSLSELDGFAPQNPLIIHHKSGHMGLLNSKALELTGVTVDTPVPEGGMIEKAEGRLTGYMEENAFFTVMQKIPMASPDQLLKAFEDTQQKYASYGITTIQDGMVAKPMLPMYRLLLEKKMLHMDVKLFAGLDTYEDTKALLAEFPENHFLQLAGLKIFLDGSPQGRTAWMRTPYEGTPDYSGYGTMTDEAVEEAFRMAGRNHCQIIAHCNGDGASDQFLRCMEKVQKEYPELKDLKPVIIHGQLMGIDQLPKARELGVMVSFFVAHTYHWGDVHIRNFGMDRASQISPAASALREGVRFTFHQDAPVIEPDMLETIWCAVNRKTRGGATIGEGERITPQKAIRAVTLDAAYQYSEESLKGSIAPGKNADFVILSEDPLKISSEEIRNIQVLETWQCGEKIFQS